jgi:hypothetical protein
MFSLLISQITFMHQLAIKTRFVDASDTYAAHLQNCV